MVRVLFVTALLVGSFVFGLRVGDPAEAVMSCGAYGASAAAQYYGSRNLGCCGRNSRWHPRDYNHAKWCRKMYAQGRYGVVASETSIRNNILARCRNGLSYACGGFSCPSSRC